MQGKKYRILTTFFLCLFFVCSVFVSCRRSELAINQLHFQPYVYSDGQMGMSVFVRTTVDDVKKIKMAVTDPSGNLTWDFVPEKTIFEELEFVGTSGIMMPRGCDLPKGLWTLELLYKDGRTVRQTFNVDWRDKEAFLENHKDTTQTDFDAQSNLVFITR